MSRALTFYSTSIGKKVVMAITGLILFGFVIGHMLGNLHGEGHSPRAHAHRLGQLSHIRGAAKRLGQGALGAVEAAHRLAHAGRQADGA